VERLFVDAAQTQPFSGMILPDENQARGDAGAIHTTLFGNAVENGAPLTMLAFRKGLGPVGPFISWSYYGDRCANYLFGPRAIRPYKAAFVLAHFLGAIASLTVAWTLGDVFLGIVILPNLLALLLLSGNIRQMTNSYFARRPWLRNVGIAKRRPEDGAGG